MDARFANKIITDLHNNINIIEVRHKYSIRKQIRLSDKEYDKFIADFKERIAVCIIRERVLTELISKLDSENKKVQKGKEESLVDQMNRSFDGLITSLVKAGQKTVPSAAPE